MGWEDEPPYLWREQDEWEREQEDPAERAHAERLRADIEQKQLDRMTAHGARNILKVFGLDGAKELLGEFFDSWLEEAIRLKVVERDAEGKLWIHM